MVVYQRHRPVNLMHLPMQLVLVILVDLLMGMLKVAEEERVFSCAQLCFCRDGTKDK